MSKPASTSCMSNATCIQTAQAVVNFNWLFEIYGAKHIARGSKTEK